MYFRQNCAERRCMKLHSVSAGLLILVQINHLDCDLSSTTKALGICSKANSTVGRLRLDSHGPLRHVGRSRALLPVSPFALAEICEEHGDLAQSKEQKEQHDDDKDDFSVEIAVCLLRNLLNLMRACCHSASASGPPLVGCPCCCGPRTCR